MGKWGKMGGNEGVLGPLALSKYIKYTMIHPDTPNVKPEFLLNFNRLYSIFLDFTLFCFLLVTFP
jgi:hypothetical protein